MLFVFDLLQVDVLPDGFVWLIELTTDDGPVGNGIVFSGNRGFEAEIEFFRKSVTGPYFVRIGDMDGLADPGCDFAVDDKSDPAGADIFDHNLAGTGFQTEL